MELCAIREIDAYVQPRKIQSRKIESWRQR
jgi:hypothetical protein